MTSERKTVKQYGIILVFNMQEVEWIECGTAVGAECRKEIGPIINCD